MTHGDNKQSDDGDRPRPSSVDPAAQNLPGEDDPTLPLAHWREPIPAAPVGEQNLLDTEVETAIPHDATAVWHQSDSGVKSLTGWYNVQGTRPQGLADSDERPRAMPDQQLSFKLPGLEVIALVGKSIALVYQAYQPSLKRFVALKVLPPAFADDPVRMARFYREAETASRFFGSSILPVYDLLEYQGQPIIVMPYVDGGTLERVVMDRLVRRSEPYQGDLHPLAQLEDADYLHAVLPILDQVVESVATLHDRSTLHRDIKPANLLLDRDGRVWLADFGLARLQEDCPITRHGQGVGTPGYMSPEQYAGARNLEPSCDVFGLAATIYRVLTLGYPYGQMRIAPDAPTPLLPSKRQPRLGTDFDYVLIKALEADPRKRYPSARAFAVDWASARRHEGKQLNVLHRIKRTVRKHARSAIVGGALTLGLSSGVIWMASGRENLPPQIGTVAVEFQTQPAQAEVAVIPLNPLTYFPPVDPSTRGIDRKQIVKFATHADGSVRVRLRPGLYLVEAGVSGFGFQQSYRQVPNTDESVRSLELPRSWRRLNDGTVVLDPIKIVGDSAIPEGRMALIQGDGEHLPSWGRNLLDTRKPLKGMPTFLLDCREVTFAEYQRVMGRLPAQVGQIDANQLQQPAHSVRFVEAMEYAERAGLRLPTEGETRYALAGTFLPIIPTSLNLWAFHAQATVDQGHDLYLADRPIIGLRTGLAEWTQTPAPGNNFGLAQSTSSSERRMVHGLSIRWVNAANRSGYPEPRRYEPAAVPFFETGTAIGFRCARSAEPMLLDQRNGPWTPVGETSRQTR